MPAADTLIADRYRLRAVVGRSEHDVVWRAVDERLRREVAVKTVNLDLLGHDPGVVDRFRREVETSGRLSSPYIVAVFDSGRHDKFAFMVMELLSGPSLAHLLGEEGPLEWERALTLAAGIASGLTDAHAAGVVHGDLAPHSVVLHGEVGKLVDFGTAAAEATPTGDLQALGSLLYALFAGRPRAGASALGAHVHAARPRLADARPDAPPELDDLLARLLAADPADRPDARTVARVLARLRDERHGPAQPAGLPPVEVTTGAAPATGRPSLGLLSWLVTIVLAGVLAVVAWVLLGQAGWGRPAPAPSPPASPSAPAPSAPLPTLGVTSPPGTSAP